MCWEQVGKDQKLIPQQAWNQKEYGLADLLLFTLKSNYSDKNTVDWILLKIRCAHTHILTTQLKQPFKVDFYSNHLQDPYYDHET